MKTRSDNKIIKLIIFDCDGVVVNSEYLAAKLLSNILSTDFGISFSLQQAYNAFVGQPTTECMKILNTLVTDVDPQLILSKFRLQYKSELENNIQAEPGISEVLSTLDMPYCIASNGSYEKMSKTLSKAGLLKYFNENIFSSEDVSRKKPFPDIYLYAARKMGNIDAKNCLVIEDSAMGVKGAASAGMHVFGYIGLANVNDLFESGANRVIYRMENLRREISEYQMYE